MNITIYLILQWFVFFVSLFFAFFWVLTYLRKDKADKVHPLKKHPFVSLLIPAYNEEKTIEQTIKSALSLKYPHDKIEFLIINDGSTDETLNKILPFLTDKRITLIDQENKGKGAAMNTALARAKGEFFVCLDADSQAHPEGLIKLLPHFTNKRVAAVMPILKIQRHNKRLNFLQKLQWYEYLVNCFFKRLMYYLDAALVVPGPFSIYRTAVIKKIGGFDEKNITEDLELTIRLHRYNYKIIQTFDSEVYTPAMSSFGAYYRQRNRWFKGGVLSAIKHRDMMFNKRWGDYGVMQMPLLIFSGIISLSLLTVVLHRIITPLLDFFQHIQYISFDVWTLIQTFQFSFILYEINPATYVILGLMFIISISILYLATYYTHEKLFTFGPQVVVLFMFIYFFLLAITWLGVATDLIRGKVQRW